jgi:cytidylate kinase
MTNREQPPIQIAIDGPVASGKSTVGERVAARLGILYVDTGVMYRAVALVALERGVASTDGDGCGVIAETLALHLMPPTVADGRQLTVLLDQRDITWEIRSEAVNRTVPIVAAHPRVRAALRAWQQRLGREQSVVMVGRDIAAIVLPEARVKILLQASLDERVRRRATEMRQRNPDQPLDEERLRQEIIERDRNDHDRTLLTPDTLIIHTDHMTIDEVVEHIVEVAHERYG